MPCAQNYWPFTLCVDDGRKHRRVEKNRYTAHKRAQKYSSTNALSKPTTNSAVHTWLHHVLPSHPSGSPLQVFSRVFTGELVVATRDETNLNAEQSRTEMLSHSNRTPVMMKEIKVIMMIWKSVIQLSVLITLLACFIKKYVWKQALCKHFPFSFLFCLTVFLMLLNIWTKATIYNERKKSELLITFSFNFLFKSLANK